LESVGPRPRQARYQAALRPDRECVKIIRDFPTELLLHLTNFASNPRMSGHRSKTWRLALHIRKASLRLWKKDCPV
jgi:hypothetical protein